MTRTGDADPGLSDIVAAVVVAAGYATAGDSANVLAAPAIWRYDGDESDQLPCGGCAESSYAVVRHYINEVLRWQGCDDEMVQAVEEHARSYLTDAYTMAMFRSALSTVTVSQMHEEILTALDKGAGQLGDRLEVVLAPPAGDPTSAPLR